MISKKEITKCTFTLLCNYGTKSITVDDIAEELGISKATVYSLFESKEEIILEVILHFIGKIMEILLRFENMNTNSIDKLLGINKSLAQFYSNINPVFFITLKKYHPKQLLLIKKYRDQIYLKTIRQIFDNGIKEGLFQSDIPINNLLYAHLSLYNMYLFDKKPSENIPAITADNVCAIFLMELKGIATKQGHSIIDKNSEACAYKTTYY